MLYKGAAEYETIAQIKATVSVPVVANGDIDSPERAREVLDYTAADGVMIGRGAQGRPWLFAQIREYLATGSYGEPPMSVVRSTMLDHAAAIHAFYGEHNGVRIARKHLRWYLERVCQISAPQRRCLLTETSAAFSRGTIATLPAACALITAGSSPGTGRNSPLSASSP